MVWECTSKSDYSYLFLHVAMVVLWKFNRQPVFLFHMEEIISLSRDTLMLKQLAKLECGTRKRNRDLEQTIIAMATRT